MYDDVLPPLEISKHLLALRVDAVAVVEVQFVANGVVLESRRFRRPINGPALVHYLPEELPQSPVEVAAAVVRVYVDARVLFVHRDARRRHTPG